MNIGKGRKMDKVVSRDKQGAKGGMAEINNMDILFQTPVGLLLGDRIQHELTEAAGEFRVVE